MRSQWRQKSSPSESDGGAASESSLQSRTPIGQLDFLLSFLGGFVFSPPLSLLLRAMFNALPIFSVDAYVLEPCRW